MSANPEHVGWQNLDRLAARAANSVVEQQRNEDCGDLDRLATKALGVFQENGVYAGMLFLLSRKQKNEQLHASQIRTAILGMLRNEALSSLGVAPKGNMENAQAVLEFVANTLAADLDRLLLVKALCEQTLIYTRYAAKAREYELPGKAKG